jgi:hypothetical protein
MMDRPNMSVPQLSTAINPTPAAISSRTVPARNGQRRAPSPLRHEIQNEGCSHRCIEGGYSVKVGPPGLQDGCLLAEEADPDRREDAHNQPYRLRKPSADHCAGKRDTLCTADVAAPMQVPTIVRTALPKPNKIGMSR